MAKDIEIQINGKKIKAQANQTILGAAKAAGIEIPALCYHPDLTIRGSCRLCLVEIAGKSGMFTACSTPIEKGMKITTNSAALNKARKINLELLFSQHREECSDCVYDFHCQLLELAKKYKIKINRFSDRKTKYPVYKFGPSLIFDSSKCIDCRNCTDVCEKQGVGFLDMKETGSFFRIVPSKDHNKDCIYCGQCIVHCPAGAFEAAGEFEEVTRPLHDRSKTIVFQFAPSIRSSIGEEFGLEPGTVVIGQLAAAIKKLGANEVFDTSVGADFTTVEEAKELIERLKTKNFPLFTSCCPAWIKFIEFYHPEFIPNLTSARSPHIILGGLIKTYWAKKQGINPKDIIVVSVMPCVSKKYEIKRKELKIDGLNPVDYVLTTRELAYLLKKNKIDFKKLKPESPDDPLGNPSGAGVIYGASGGVMESALRTAKEQLEGKKLSKINFEEVRGEVGLKTAKIDVKDRSLKVAVANGIGNAIKILQELKKNPRTYDYVEVMACFGGCIGGGGQPLPTDPKTRGKRARGLYQIDSTKNIRSAHRNPALKEVYKKFLKNKEIIRQVCHTSYFPKQKEN